MCLQADATNENASLVGRCIDLSVQTLGQPNPAMTHCELWVAEKRTTDDNHFGQYLGQSDPNTGELTGALWTSGLSTSPSFYRSKSWVAIPVYALDVERRVRDECDLNVATPYPSWWTLFDYPWSVWPLRSMAGLFKSDSVHASAHCAALSARILRHALPELPLRHDSHWYGPASLYLELSTPYQMKRALHLQRPPGVVRSQAEEDRDSEDDALLETLLYGNDEEVAEMTAAESRKAVAVAALKVLQAGAGDSADDVDQTLFLQAQKHYAQAMVRHAWVGRVGRHRADLMAEQAAATEAADAAVSVAAARIEAQEAAAQAEAASAAQATTDAAADAAAVAEATARFKAEGAAE